MCAAAVNFSVPALTQPMNRRSGLPSAVMLTTSRALSKSTAVHSPVSTRYESVLFTGLTRSQNASSPASAILSLKVVVPSFSSEELLSQLPPESCSRLT